MSHGLAFGYYANGSKTWLVSKESHLDKAREVFLDTQVSISPKGRPLLSAPLGSKEFIDQFVSKKISQWREELSLLAEMAKSQPHAAYTAFTHGYMYIHKFSYFCRTIPDLELPLQPLEDHIRSLLIPSLTGRGHPNDPIRKLLNLPSRHGRFGLVNPANSLCSQFEASIRISEPLKNLILEQNSEYPLDCIDAQVKAKSSVFTLNRDNAKDLATALRGTLSGRLQCAMDLAQEKGASSY